MDIKTNLINGALLLKYNNTITDTTHILISEKSLWFIVEVPNIPHGLLHQGKPKENAVYCN